MKPRFFLMEMNSPLKKDGSGRQAGRGGETDGMSPGNLSKENLEVASFSSPLLTNNGNVKC